jgi:hypothetical protein
MYKDCRDPDTWFQLPAKVTNFHQDGHLAVLIAMLVVNCLFRLPIQKQSTLVKQ